MFESKFTSVQLKLAPQSAPHIPASQILEQVEKLSETNTIAFMYQNKLNCLPLRKIFKWSNI